MAFRKLVGSYKDYKLSTHIIEHGYLAVDVDTGSLRLEMELPLAGLKYLLEAVVHH